MKICLDEIERSQKVSPKPNFIVLLGNRYGWRPLPYEIPADEFELILSNVSEKERKILLWDENLNDGGCGWYRKDENSIPSVYCLQHRNIKFKDYKDWNESDKKTWGNSWIRIEDYLHLILFKGASKLELNHNDYLKYYASATEQEIFKGALNVDNAEEHVFCFFRNIEDLSKDKDFVDLDLNGNLNLEVQNYLENLKIQLCTKLPRSHIKYSNVEFVDDVNKHELKELSDDVYIKLKKIIMEEINVYNIKEFNSDINNSDYYLKNREDNLDKYAEDVYTNLIKVIDYKSGYSGPKTKANSLKSYDFNTLSEELINETNEIGTDDPIENEIVDHENFGKEKAKFFTGRDEILNSIFNYLEDKNSNLFDHIW